MSGFLDGGIGGAIGGVTGLISNIFQNRSNAKQNRLNRQFAREEAAMAHERQLQIMDKQNEWNTPENQRSLLTSAGYNPNTLFSGGATSISTGASGGAQASTPSNIPMQGLMSPDAIAGLITAVSQAQLNEKQGNLIDAQAKKTGSETIGQDLQNTYDELRNQIYAEFGRLQAQYGLDYQDSQRALNDAQRLLTNSEHSLNFNELAVMRPLEAGKTIAETLYAQAQSEWLRIQGLKSETDRHLAIEQFKLSQTMAAATIANLYAEAYESRMRGNLYGLEYQWRQPGGLLHTNQRFQNDNLLIDYNRKSLNYRYKRDAFESVFKRWQDMSNELFGKSYEIVREGGNSSNFDLWIVKNSLRIPSLDFGID